MTTAAKSAAPASSTVTYIQAIHAAQQEELRRDPSVILLGQDVERNVWGTSRGFVEEFGADRIRDVPISELSFAGAAIGAAMTGMRPIVDFSIATFMMVAMEQIVSQAAKARYMYGGQTSVPVVFRACEYYGASIAAHHSDRPHSTFMTIPGLKIIFPASPADAKGLLKAAIRDENPVIMFEGLSLWTQKGEVPDGDYVVEIGKATVRRAGSDVTIVAIGPEVPIALRAADVLAKEGISAEVIDPRTLVPMDWSTIFESVARTGRLVVADIGPRTCSAASEIVATVSQERFFDLKAPPVRVVTPDVQIPFSPSMEHPLYPSRDSIAAAARGSLG